MNKAPSEHDCLEIKDEVFSLTKCVGKDVGEKEPMYTAGGNVN
jgi:hypothetical protein